MAGRDGGLGREHFGQQRQHHRDQQHPASQRAATVSSTTAARPTKPLPSRCPTPPSPTTGWRRWSAPTQWCHYDLKDLLSSPGNRTDGIVYRTFATTNGTWRNIGLPYIIEGQGGVGHRELLVDNRAGRRGAHGQGRELLGARRAVRRRHSGAADHLYGQRKTGRLVEGIQIDNNGVAELRFCDIGYGGNSWAQRTLAHWSARRAAACRLRTAGIDDSSNAAIQVRCLPHHQEQQHREQ